MYEYERKILTTAKNYNLQERDVIFTYLIAAGISRADAYHVIYHRNHTIKHDHQATDVEAADFMAARPAIRLLIQKLKNRQPVNSKNSQQEAAAYTQQAAEEQQQREREEGGGEGTRAERLRTAHGLVKILAEEVSGIHGKESVQGLIQLAKLQGFDREDTKKEDERRRFVLTWLSHCRSCALMRAYLDVQGENRPIL